MALPHGYAEKIEMDTGEAETDNVPESEQFIIESNW